MLSMRCRIEIGLLALTVFISSSILALPPQAPSPEVKSLIDQNLILVGYGRLAEVAFSNESMLYQLGASCDVPVVIRNASYSKTQLKIDVETIGWLGLIGNSQTTTPRVPCQGSSYTTKLTIKNVKPEVLTGALKSVADNLLMTPETYLQHHDISFDFPPVTGKEEPVLSPRGGPMYARPVLTFSPGYTDAAIKARVKGSVSVALVIGSDGRVQSSNIVKGLGRGLDEQALRILKLWRWEPAQISGRRVAVNSSSTFSFNIQ